MGKANWSIRGSGRSMTKKQTEQIEKAANESNENPKRFFQKLARLPASAWKGLQVHIEKGFKRGKKTDDWFSETVLFPRS